jgi:WXG100 family type VII secretion target
MAGYQATPEELSQWAKHLHEVKAQLDAQVTKMDSTVDGIQAGWKGNAATKFDTLQQQVREVMQRINQRLDAIAIAMEKTSGNYSTNEDNQASRMSGISAI